MEQLLSLKTNIGIWVPVLWLASMIIAFIIGWIIWKMGNSSYQKDTEQTKAFFSGNQEPGPEILHVKSGNLYWGFLKSMDDYYKKLVPIHTGVVSDYLLWMFGTMATILIIGLCV